MPRGAAAAGAGTRPGRPHGTDAGSGQRLDAGGRLARTAWPCGAESPSVPANPARPAAHLTLPLRKPACARRGCWPWTPGTAAGLELGCWARRRPRASRHTRLPAAPAGIATQLTDALASALESYPEVPASTGVADAQSGSDAGQGVCSHRPRGDRVAFRQEERSRGRVTDARLLSHVHGPVTVIPAGWPCTGASARAYRPRGQGRPAVLPRCRTGWN